ncbi:MAG: ZIP family metal transporter [Candidatus Micrarchaeota archaeon]|nr:ZIP family metal transporter [Candidatus Micrarchaeota archaeon]
MDPTVIGIALVTFLSTLVGGAVTLKFRNVLPYFFAFASGSLIAVSFFDMLPESLEISESIALPVRYVMITVVASFFFYSFLEKYFLTHHYHEDEGREHGHIMGPVGAGGLVIHSFLDGVAIGTAYQVNASIGLIVAFAVIFHDFTDGANTVTLMLKNRHPVKNAKLFLLMDAIAPVLGVLFASLVSISQVILALILAAFAGEFIYLGAANLLPETHKHEPWKMNLCMALGILLILILTSII